MVRNGTSGHQRAPAGTSGHQRAPSDTIGHHRTPSDTSGHQRTPADTSGHQRAPSDTSGHHRTPAGTIGHHRTPAGTSGHHRTPAGTSSHQQPPGTPDAATARAYIPPDGVPEGHVLRSEAPGFLRNSGKIPLFRLQIIRFLTDPRGEYKKSNRITSDCYFILYLLSFLHTFHFIIFAGK